MIKFRAKEFSKVGKVAKKAWDKYKSNMPAALSTGTLTVSSANYLTNRSRHKNAAEYQKKQLDAMNKLTEELKNTANSMNTVNNSIQNMNIKPEKESNGKGGVLIKFRRKLSS